MSTFELSQLLKEHKQAGRLYLEFLRVPSLSLGLYVLAAGATDPQKPHTEDEDYFISRGKGMINVDGEDTAVQAGSVLFVPAGAAHRFHSITEELQILVFFAPAEGATGQPASR